MMKSESFLRLSRDEINQLPLRKYEGPIQLIRSDAELLSIEHDLARESLCGFDTETRPAFKKGRSYLPALMQFATDKMVYLFQLHPLTFPNALTRILANPKILKVGVALDKDLKELQKLAPFEPAGIIELSALAKQRGIGNRGLRGLAAYLLGFRISKRAKTSNWEREQLTETQIQYAATDAWVSREIYLKLRHQ